MPPLLTDVDLARPACFPATLSSTIPDVVRHNADFLDGRLEPLRRAMEFLAPVPDFVVFVRSRARHPQALFNCIYFLSPNASRGTRQQQVREGTLCAQLAMKYLVPVASVSVVDRRLVGLLLRHAARRSLGVQELRQGTEFLLLRRRPGARRQP